MILFMIIRSRNSACHGSATKLLWRQNWRRGRTNGEKGSKMLMLTKSKRFPDRSFTWWHQVVDRCASRQSQARGLNQARQHTSTTIRPRMRSEADWMDVITTRKWSRCMMRRAMSGRRHAAVADCAWCSSACSAAPGQGRLHGLHDPSGFALWLWSVLIFLDVEFPQ